MHIRRLTSTGLLALAIVSGGLALGASPALAGTGYGPVSGQFGAAGSGDGEFSGPAGIAVDNDPASPSEGDVYVADSGNGRVQKFSAAGDYISQFDGSEAPGGPIRSPLGVAVDPSNGNVWVSGEDGEGKVYEFSAEGKYAGVELTGTPASAPITGEKTLYAPAGVAVDPSNGDIYVADYHYHVVDVFTSAGAYVSQFSTGALAVTGVAIGSTGNLYVTGSDVEGGAEGGLQQFSSAGTLEAKLADNGSDWALVVDPASGEVYVAGGFGGPLQAFQGGELIYEFGPSKDLGLAVSSSGTIYTTDDETNEVKLFAPGATAPEPKTETAQVKGVEVTLDGELLGGESSYYFAYNTNGTCKGAGKTPEAAASGAVKESAQPEELEPNAKYTFCIAARNEYGPEFGAPASFETEASPPLVKGEVSASLVSREAASLAARVNPEKQETTCAFEYGESEPYTKTACEQADLGSGFGPQPASLRITGLNPGGSYHYRVVAGNATGETTPSEGAGVFYTLANPPIALTGKAAAVSRDGARIAGEVNPDAQNPNGETSYYFQYGTSGFYGSQTPQPAGVAGQGSKNVSESAELSGLEAGTTYHYRIVASNDYASVAGDAPHEPQVVYGQDKTFTTLGTPPALGVPTVSEVSQTGASIVATLDPEGLPTHWELRLGDTPGALSAQEGGNLSGSATQTLTVNVGPFAAGSVHYYQLLAYNADGAVQSEEGSFATLPATAGQSQAAPAFPLLALPEIAFPAEEAGQSTVTGKALTRAQKLSAALAKCRKKTAKSRRAACEKQAHRKYGPKTKTKSKKRK
jgi:DNA-binding beta-propeller fold protein YncE